MLLKANQLLKARSYVTEFDFKIAGGEWGTCRCTANQIKATRSINHVLKDIKKFFRDC